MGGVSTRNYSSLVKRGWKMANLGVSLVSDIFLDLIDWIRKMILFEDLPKS